MERTRDNEAQARLSELDGCTARLADLTELNSENGDEVTTVLNIFAPGRPVLSPEGITSLSMKEKLALNITSNFSDQMFEISSTSCIVGDDLMKDYFKSLSSTIPGILHPTGKYGKDTFKNYVLTRTRINQMRGNSI